MRRALPLLVALVFTLGSAPSLAKGGGGGGHGGGGHGGGHGHAGHGGYSHAAGGGSHGGSSAQRPPVGACANGGGCEAREGRNFQPPRFENGGTPFSTP